MKIQKGFIALTSVLVLSAIFLSVTISMATRAIGSAYLTTAYVERDKARMYAEACLETALIELQRTLSYTEGDTITVGDGTCEVSEVGGGASDRTITIRSDVGSHTYHAQAHLSTQNPLFEITDYQRIP